MTNEEKIKLARRGTSPAPSLSPETIKGLQAVASEAPSSHPEEDVRDNIPEHLLLDPLFSDVLNPPSLELANVARRKKIESRLNPLRIDDLFISGELRQVVPIVPGKLEVTYRTLTGEEDLYAKRRMGDARGEISRYVEDRFVMMVLCLHIHTINGETYPSIFDESGRIDEKNFNIRFQKMTKIPHVLIEDIWVNYRFFEDRVRRALEPEALKGG